MRAGFLLFFLLLAHGVRADDEAPAIPQPATLDEANAQRARATAMRDEAKARYERESVACYKKFLVSDCIEEAQKRQRQALVDARHFDAPALKFQQDHRRAEAAARKQRRAEEQAARDVEARRDAADFQVKEASEKLDREQQTTKRQRKIAMAREKNAKDRAKQQEREQSRKEREAKRAAKTAREEAAFDAHIVSRTPTR